MPSWAKLLLPAATSCAVMMLLAAAPSFAEPAPDAPVPTADTKSPEAAAPAALPVQEPPKVERLGAVVRARLGALSPKLDNAGVADVAALKAFYEARKDEPLWIEGDSLKAKAKSAIGEIKKAEEWGLDAASFEVPDPAADMSTREKAAEAEAKLSLAVLAYARHARGGRITDPARQLSSYLDRMPQLIEPKVVLETIATTDDVDATLRGFHPKHPQFEKLRQKYLEMRASTAAAETVVKVPPGANLIPGQKHANVALLRQRLKVPVQPGASGEAGDETFFDDALVSAVKAFQTEEGFRADGIVGPNTRNALNDVETPSPSRFLANMEQWRWMPEDLGDYYVWINVPEFLVRVVKGGQIIHEERVVTGLPDKQTPIFSAGMELVTFHPVWNVPESIKVRELYPSLARGGTYFQRQGLRLMQNGRPVDPSSVDWGSADIRRFDVQQPSGPSNVLGAVKLSFPNKHIVYMHDTSTKNLFNETTRAFSHGCVRVRDPLKLAALVLEKDKGLDEATVRSMAGGAAVENPVQLATKIPVHITYFTSWIGDDGTERRFKDVYGHETRITLALEGKFDKIARGPDHLAPASYPKVQVVQNPVEELFTNIFGGF